MLDRHFAGVSRGKMAKMSRLLVLSLAFIFVSIGSAQHITPPATCVPGEELIDLGSQGKYTCIATNTWKYVPISSLLYTHIGVANGVPPLDQSGKIPLRYLPDSVLGGGPGGTGTDGYSVRSGTGAPDTTIGIDGDFYIDTASARLNFYGPKVAGSWPTSFVPLVGVSGTNGSAILTGTTTPLSTQGNNGDYFIDSTAKILYGPKASGAWPGTGIALGSGASVVAPTSYPFNTSSSSTFTIVHNLGTRNLSLTCFDANDNWFITPWKPVDNNTITATIPIGRTGRCTPISASGPQGPQGPAGSSSSSSGPGTTGSGIPVGSTLPSTCTDGSFFYLTGEDQGKQLYNCNGTSWLPYLTVDTSGSLAIVSGSLGVTDIIPRKANDETITGLWTLSQFSLGTPSTPTSSSASCTQGRVTYDASFIYFCVATNTWRRVAISSSTF